jgi:hypothetical protein
LIITLVFFRRKSAKIAKNCVHNIDFRWVRFDANFTVCKKRCCCVDPIIRRLRNLQPQRQHCT